MNIYLIYAARKLAQAVELIVDSSQKDVLSKWIDKINAILKDLGGGDADSIVEEIDRIKALTGRELLNEWYSCYSVVRVYGCYGRSTVEEMDMLWNELSERGMEREIEKLTGGCQTPLSSEQMEVYFQQIGRFSDAELLREHKFYEDISQVGHFFVTEDGQRIYALDCELHKRGLNRKRTGNSEEEGSPTALGSIIGGEDQNLGPGANVIPASSDAKRESCGRPSEELKPFREDHHPIVDAMELPSIA